MNLIERECIYLNAKPSLQTSTAHSNVLIPSDTPINSCPLSGGIWSSKVSRVNVKISHIPFICNAEAVVCSVGFPKLAPGTDAQHHEKVEHC
jgi:hypothetical protein